MSTLRLAALGRSASEHIAAAGTIRPRVEALRQSDLARSRALAVPSYNSPTWCGEPFGCRRAEYVDRGRVGAQRTDRRTRSPSRRARADAPVAPADPTPSQACPASL